jgi:hypothetical protein
VRRALAARGDLSDRSIAKLCGVSHPFVSKLRRARTAATAPEEGLVAGNDEETDVHPDLVNPPDDEAGNDPDGADAASDPALDARRREHATLLAASVQANTAPPTVASPLEAFEPRDGAEAAPPAGTTRILNDLPVFREEESEPPITVITRPAPRAAPDTRELPEQVYADEHRALQHRLHNERRHHSRLLEKVARGEATAADLARSRGTLRDLKDQLEDVAALAAHTATVARERAERDRVDRYYAAVARTDADFAALVHTAAVMDRLVVELSAAREQFHTLLGGGLVDLRTQAGRLPAPHGGPHSRLREAITNWTAHADGLEHQLLHRLSAVGALRTLRNLGQAPTPPDDQLASWTQGWTRRAIEVARSQGPARLDPDPESADDTDDDADPEPA